MGYRRKALSRSGVTKKTSRPEGAWAAIDRAASWRYTGVAIGAAYVLVAAVIAFSYHRMLDYGMESDFLYEYVPVAKEIAHLRLPIPAFRGPVYPILVAGVTGLVRDYFVAGMLIGLASAGAVIALSFGLIRRAFDGRIALGAIVLLVCNPYFFLYTYQVGTDLPFVALATASVYLMVKQPELSWKRVAGSAALGSLAYLTRYNGIFLLAIPLLIIFLNLWKTGWRSRVLAATMFCAVFFACIAPWGLYCLKEKGSFFYSENYQNVAFDVYAKDTMTREEFFWKGNPFEGMSITALVRHDPRTFFGALARNFVGHGVLILGELVGWPIGVIAIAGLALLVWQRPTVSQGFYLLLNLAFYVVLLPIHLEIRYPLFMLCAFATLACCALSLADVKIRMPAVRIACVVLFAGLIVWSAIGSYRLNAQAISNGPVEVLEIVKRYRSAVPPEKRGRSVAARKPHIAYYAGLEYVPIPVVDSPEELVKQLRELKVDYLYFGKAEYSMRPGLRALIDPRRTWPGLTRIASTDDPLSFLYRVE